MRGKDMKLKTLRLAALAAAAVALGQAAAQDATLRWALHPGAEADAVIDYFAPRYEEETGVKVIGEILPAGQLRDQMSIEAIGNTGRWDMGYHSPGWFGTFAPHVIDLTPLIEKHGFDVSAYPDLVVNSHMTSSAREGEYIALPTTPAAPMLIVREDWFAHPDEQAAFEKAHGRALEVPRTFAELREVAGFFTRKEGDMLAGETLARDVYGWADALGAGVGITRSFIVVLYSAGIHGWDESFQPDIGHPIVAEVAEYFVDLAKNTAPREAQNWGFLEGLEMFRDGRLAMATMWPQGVGIVETEGGDAAGNVGYSPLPVWEGNLAGYTQGTPFLGGGGVFIFKTANSDEAFKFLKWMLQDNEVEWGKRSEQFSRKAHFQSEELRTLQPFYDDFLPAFEQVLESVFIRQGIPEYGAVMWSGATDFITDVYSGDLTPEQAQVRWAERMTEAFKAAGYIQ